MTKNIEILEATGGILLFVIGSTRPISADLGSQLAVDSEAIWLHDCQFSSKIIIRFEFI